ncbi:MAG: hypothetical protein ACRCT8_04400 [Lacipirellulaceae bacterium]
MHETDPGEAPEPLREGPLQEFVTSGGATLLGDPLEGVLRGVKLLGLRSRNGRVYRETALRGAMPLYEGAKVNVNHPAGDPLGPRDYRDRLGVVRNVRLVAEEGLFGDLHYNPRHALAEQLAWDAEHASQNVGLSHNVVARTRSSAEGVIVEEITGVRSVDLVADPATTAGLFEHEALGAIGERPSEAFAEVERLREELRCVGARRRVEGALLARRLSIDGEPPSEALVEALVEALAWAPPGLLDAAVDGLARLVRAGGSPRSTRPPESRESPVYAPATGAPRTSREFVAAITKRRP